MNQNRPFPLAEFEAHAHARKHDKAMADLLGMLGQMQLGLGARGPRAMRAYTRLASAVTALFADPGFAPDTLAFGRLSVYKRTLDAVFRLSAFGGYAHLRGMLNRQTGDAAALKHMFCHALDSAGEPDFPELFKRFPEQALCAYLGLLSTKCVLRPQAWKRREQLLAHGPRLADIPLPASAMSLVKSAWMLCSYAGGADKHGIKAHLNAMIEDLIARSGLSPALPNNRPKTGKRPVLVVCAEIFTPGHAMFRCYAPALEQLRGTFELVVVSGPESLDARVRATFDACIEAPDDIRALPGILRQIQAHQPDVIYYPSLGMRPWALALANMRLAPVQVMSLGHPATSRSRHMDFVVAGAHFDTREKVFSEILVLMNAPGFPQAERQAERPEPLVRDAPKPLKLAVNAKSFKLNPPLLNLYRRIASEAGRRLEFHFFPGEKGILLQLLRAEIKARLPRAVVHPATDYQSYLNALNECDMALGAHPFGGTNSAVDLMLLGIPLVSLEGDEPHSRTETRFMRALGLPEQLMARTPEGFVQAATRLITNDQARQDICRQIIKADPAGTFFEREHSLFADDFKDTLLWICNNHEHIKNSGLRVIPPGRRHEAASALGS